MKSRNQIRDIIYNDEAEYNSAVNWMEHTAESKII